MEDKGDILGPPSLRRPRRSWSDGRSGISVLILLICSTLASYWVVTSQLGWARSPFTADKPTRAVGHVAWGTCDNWSLPRAECGSIMYVTYGPLHYRTKPFLTAYHWTTSTRMPGLRASRWLATLHRRAPGRASCCSTLVAQVCTLVGIHDAHV